MREGEAHAWPGRVSRRSLDRQRFEQQRRDTRAAIHGGRELRGPCPEHHRVDKRRGARASASSVVDVVRKPSSVPCSVARSTAANHSSTTTVPDRLEQPTRGLERAILHRFRRPCGLGERHTRLCGLAPDGVCRAASVTGSAVSFYPAVSPLPGGLESRPGGLFSVALSLAFPPPGVTRHRALWSSDFPPAMRRASRPDVSPAIACTASTRAA